MLKVKYPAQAGLGTFESPPHMCISPLIPESGDWVCKLELRTENSEVPSLASIPCSEESMPTTSQSTGSLASCSWGISPAGFITME